LLRTAGPKLCTDCHGELAERFEQAKHVHPPVKDDCTVCHPPHGAANEALLKALQPALCLECHDGIGELMTSAIHKHSPLANDASCAACHDPHASAVGGLLLKPSMDLCLSCHNREIPHGSEQVANIGETLATRANHHGPIRQEDCGSCHEPHGGAHANLLKKGFPDRFYVSYTDEAYALCFECHEVEAFTEQETDSATGFRNGSQNLHYLHVNQSPKGRSCRVCHDPHATTGTKLVMESVPFGKWQVPIRFRETATGGSCGPGCHRAYRYERGEAALNIPPR
jgi:predicted CXXCH cytochrome family protein